MSFSALLALLFIANHSNNIIYLNKQNLRQIQQLLNKNIFSGDKNLIIFDYAQSVFENPDHGSSVAGWRILVVHSSHSTTSSQSKISKIIFKTLILDECIRMLLQANSNITVLKNSLLSMA